MGSIVRFLSLQWGRFATRTGLRALPAMPAAAAVLVIGVMAPLLAQIERRPPALTTSLAQERLERFLQGSDVWPAGDVVVPRPELAWRAMPRAATYKLRLLTQGDRVVAGAVTTALACRLDADLAPGEYRVTVTGVDAGGDDVETREGSFTVVEATPRGEVRTRRPAFHGRAAPDAAAYRVRVLRADGSVVLERTETEPRALVRPPSAVRPGEDRLVVEALGRGGDVVATRTAEFRVASRGEAALGNLASEMRIILDRGEAALVLGGHYAAHGTIADVVAARGSHVHVRGAQATPLALRVLRRCGVR